MPFWGSLFGGSNPTLNQGINQAGQIAGFGQSQGQGLTTQAGNFFSGLMSGNQGQIAKLVAPQIQGLQQGQQNQATTTAQFGGRSGGTNAAAQSASDVNRGTINNMISQLTASAASGASSLGTSLLGTGLDALNMGVGFSQQQMQNWQNSILGSTTGAVVGAATAGAVSA